jgi:quercetin dioxygenase-like cupin family protein
MGKLRTVILGVLGVAGVVTARADIPPETTAAIVQNLMQRQLAACGNQEVRMLTVEYAPGASSPPHQHHAQVFVYVLEGHVRMQVKGSAEVDLGPGGVFYESVNDVHTVSANASTTERARLLVLTVGERAKQETPAASGGAQQ